VETPSLSHPASFFYEWEPLTKDEEKKKISKPGRFLFLTSASSPSAASGTDGKAGRREKRNRQNEIGKNEIVVESFSIITTDPNEILEPFHNRCPLIIDAANYERWLAPTEPSHLPIDLVRTWPAEDMKAWRVAKLQGNGPDLLKPLAESSA